MKILRIKQMRRGEGKTTACILELAKNPKAILIVANQQMARQIIQDYAGIPNIYKRVYPVLEMHLIDKNKDYDIVIDELEMVLSRIFMQDVTFATNTIEGEGMR